MEIILSQNRKLNREDSSLKKKWKSNKEIDSLGFYPSLAGPQFACSSETHLRHIVLVILFIVA